MSIDSFKKKFFSNLTVVDSFEFPPKKEEHPDHSPGGPNQEDESEKEELPFTD